MWKLVDAFLAREVVEEIISGDKLGNEYVTKINTVGQTKKEKKNPTGN